MIGMSTVRRTSYLGLPDPEGTVIKFFLYI
jgi:hypothetical protein